MGYNCSTPIFPLIGSARLFYGCSCIVVIVVSLMLQMLFAAVCQRMKGWKSDFGFYLLQIMAFFCILSYVGMFISYMHGLTLFQSTFLATIAGANYQGSFFAFVLSNLCLTAHRLIYTLLPMKAPLILNVTFEKSCITFLFCFYIIYLAISMTPLATVSFCPAHFFFYFERRPLFVIMSTLNQISNYAVGIVNVTAYSIMFTVMFINGTLTFKRNCEIRMTVQAAIVSLFELMFFVYWEYGPSAALPKFWERMINAFSMLVYFDILILPYILLNKNVKLEMKKILHEQSSSHSATLKNGPHHVKVFAQRSI